MRNRNEHILGHWSRRGRAGLLALAMVLSLLGTSLSGCSVNAPLTPPSQVDPSENGVVAPLTRLSLLDFSSLTEKSADASLSAYQVRGDLSDLMNAEQFYLTDSQKALLASNQFFVDDTYYNEFFELYEDNRYFQIPNFVTVDSLMHTYHLYFSLLLNRTEKNYLAGGLSDLSFTLLAKAEAQYEALKGTEWEEAARRCVALFAVGARLQDEGAALPECAADMAEAELQQIYAAQGIGLSPLTEDYLDYTQFIPRGYYEGDPVLEAYFRAMMWYGQVNFAQNAERLNRSALLMTLALRETALPTWEMLYTVTAFFAGASDDLGYYEYAPAIEAAYGAMPTLEDLTANEAAYETFAALVGQMDPPAINSVPVMEGTENIPEVTKGFRLMGQRFTLDAAVMQQLVYSNVKENAAGEKRMLPDVLDLPAALGSDLALSLLDQQGAAGYAVYSEAM